MGDHFIKYGLLCLKIKKYNGCIKKYIFIYYNPQCSDNPADW